MESQKLPWWVRTLERSNYEIDSEKLKRFDARNMIFCQFAVQNGFPPEQEGIVFSGLPMVRPNAGAGWTHIDRALAMGANTIRYSSAARTLYSWNRVQTKIPMEMGVEAHTGTPDENSKLVKKAAIFYGAADAGIAHLDRRFVYSHDPKGRPILFKDVSEPQISETERVIPDKCKYVIALAIPQSLRAIAQSPDIISDAGIGWAYSLMPVIAGSVAEFIRCLGYNAIPCGNDTALSVPIAIDAGLGEQSRMGVIIHPLFGANLRLAKIITDMPLLPDKPISFGATEFCRTCKKCAKHCPSGSISTGDMCFEGTGSYNNPGHKSWYLQADKCLAQWRKVNTGCSVCVRVCPYNKEESFVHRFVRVAVAKTNLLNSLFSWGDDLMGYGHRQSATKWWLNNTRSTHRPPV